MGNNEEEYIEYNLNAIRKLLDITYGLNRYIKTGFFDERDNPVEGIKEDLSKLKTALLVTMLSADYNELCASSVNISKRLKTVNFPVGETGFDSLSSGFQIFRLVDYAEGEPRSVLREIRNAVAHAKYSYEEEKLYLDSSTILAVLPTEYFEELMLNLFSDSNRERKKGSKLEILMPIKKQIKTKEEYESYIKNTKIIEFEAVNKLTTENLYDISRNAILKLFDKKLNSFESFEQLAECLDKEIGEDVKVTTKKAPQELETFFNSNDTAFIKEDLAKQRQILETMNRIFSKVRTKDMIAYETILEIIDSIDEFGVDYKKLEKSGNLYYLPFCQQLLSRTHMNMSFNYSFHRNHDKNHHLWKSKESKESKMILNIRNALVHEGVDFINPFAVDDVSLKFFEKDEKNKLKEIANSQFKTEVLLGMGSNVFDKYKTFEKPHIPKS